MRSVRSSPIDRAAELTITPIWHFYGSKGEEIQHVNSELQRAKSIRSSDLKELKEIEKSSRKGALNWRSQEMGGNRGKTEVGARLSCLRSVSLYVS